MKRRIVLFGYFVSGIAALVYELGWMRELSTMLGSTAYAQGIMLGAYMAGLGIGGLVASRVVEKLEKPLLWAVWAEMAVAALSIVTFIGLHFGPSVYFDVIRRSGGVGLAPFLSGQFVLSFIIMALPTTAMGLTYPFLIKALRDENALGKLAGQLYAVNTTGAILGSLCTTFVLLPTVGVKGSLIAAACLSSLAALSFLLSAGEANLGTQKTRMLIIVGVTAVAVIVSLSFVPKRLDSPLGLGQAFYYKDSKDFKKYSSQRKTLFDREGIYSRVQVVENPDGTKTLCNGALDEGTDNPYDRVTTTMLAAVPAHSVEKPNDALIVGLGTGYTSQTYHGMGFKQVDTVEINPDVLPASKYFISDLPSNDTSWKIIVDDARAHILTNDKKYDCITSEPSWPWSSGVAALFTQEFMTAAKSRLTEDGVFCQWLPNYLLRTEDVKMMYKTMRQVYDEVDVWSINFPNDYNAELLLVGHSGRTKSQAQAKADIDKYINSQKWGSELIAPQCITPYAGVAELESGLNDKSIPLNTDNHSQLEYRVFWNFVRNATSGEK